nr:MAG TPA: hypothetical protein [Bacteriophage sp.]
MGMFSPYGFRALENQNAADTQAANVAPTMPGYSGFDSKSFAEMRTPEDQIHWLYLYATALEMGTINAEQAQALIDAATATLKAYVDAQDKAISADVMQRYNYLLGLIQQLTEFPGTVPDPTWGTNRSIKIVVDRVYDFNRPFSVTAKDYDAMGYTAKAYDSKGITAREFDVTFAAQTYNDWVAKGKGYDMAGKAVSYRFMNVLAKIR